MARMYTMKEKIKIIEYLVNKQEYERIGGIEMWREMEATLGMNRSSQSLKEHFRKQIVNQLHWFEHIFTPQQIESLRRRRNCCVRLTPTESKRCELNLSNQCIDERKEIIQKLTCLNCTREDLGSNANGDAAKCSICGIEFNIEFDSNNRLCGMERTSP